MLGRDLINEILDKDLANEEIQIVAPLADASDPDEELQRYDIVTVNATLNEDDDATGTIVIAEQ